MFTQFCKNDKNGSTHKSRGIQKKIEVKKTARITSEETKKKIINQPRLRDHLEFLISISPNFFFNLINSINLIFLFL